MIKTVLSLFLGLILFCAAPSYAKTHKRGAKRSATAASSKSKAASTKTASTTRSKRTSRKMASSTKRGGKTGAQPTSSSSRSRRSRSTRTVARRSMQQAPTPDRYREIQQTLADKGYYQGPVNGEWHEDSVEALRRFQKDQNLTETGKLDSVSLIALGLGPKRSLSAGSTSETRPKDDNRRPEGSERP